MNKQEILLEEIKHQTESVLNELWHYLVFLKRQRVTGASMENVVADTGGKLGPAPELDQNEL